MQGIMGYNGICSRVARGLLVEEPSGFAPSGCNTRREAPPSFLNCQVVRICREQGLIELDLPGINSLEFRANADYKQGKTPEGLARRVMLPSVCPARLPARASVARSLLAGLTHPCSPRSRSLSSGHMYRMSRARNRSMALPVLSRAGGKFRFGASALGTAWRRCAGPADAVRALGLASACR